MLVNRYVNVAQSSAESLGQCDVSGYEDRCAELRQYLRLKCFSVVHMHII